MQLPLYFAIFSPDVPQDLPQGISVAAAGCTFSPHNGSILRPVPIPAELLILCDRLLPRHQSPAPYIRALLQILSEGKFKGLMFDFERPVNAFCTAFLSQLQPALPRPLLQILPPHYADASSDSLILVSACRPCNSFQRFCEDAQRRFPDRWCLEVMPWNFLIRAHRRVACSYEQMHRLRRTAPMPERQNPSACCMIGSSGGSYRVFDTAETLRQKLQIAERCGCRLAIGIYDELHHYFGTASPEPASPSAPERH